jgi:hypothetical protein
MDTLIELNEADLEAIAGGIGFASFSLKLNSAVGTVGATVTAVVAQATTATSAAQAALITSQAV